MLLTGGLLVLAGSGAAEPDYYKVQYIDPFIRLDRTFFMVHKVKKIKIKNTVVGISRYFLR